MALTLSAGASVGSAQSPVKSDSSVATDSVSAVLKQVATRDSTPDVATAVSKCDSSGSDVEASRVGVGAVFVGGNALLYRYFKRAWWSGERAKHFFFRADWDEDFRDQDKFGHMLGGFHLARIGGALL
ncbi:MAG TPA: hypothetical protein VGJ64_03020, partial [Gemmatimonadaceae bacterium]